jgi:hypothetical protein
MENHSLAGESLSGVTSWEEVVTQGDVDPKIVEDRKLEGRGKTMGELEELVIHLPP